MFRKIVVAYNGSPEAERAFAAAMKLAQSLNAELLTVTAMDSLPAYTAFAGVADSSIARLLEQDRLKFYAETSGKGASPNGEFRHRIPQSFGRRAMGSMPSSIFYASKKRISW